MTLVAFQQRVGARIGPSCTARTHHLRCVCSAPFNAPQVRARRHVAERTVPQATGEETLSIETGNVTLPKPKQLSHVETLADKAVKGPYLAYARALEAHPLTTKALTSFVGFIIGDLLAQSAAPGAWNALRTLRLAMYGLLIDGPVGATWYDFLDDRVFPEDPRSTKAVLAKTALDQLVYATVMTGVYFFFIKTAEGHPGAVYATLASKFVPTLAANWCIWPLAHLVNFKYVAPGYRILYNNVVALAWLTWLSWITHHHLNLFTLLSHNH